LIQKVMSKHGYIWIPII